MKFDILFLYLWTAGFLYVGDYHDAVVAVVGATVLSGIDSRLKKNE